MNVLVAGCGWLGREVASRLTARGDRVHALTRTEASAAALRAQRIDAESVDLAVPGSWHPRTERFDGIVSAIAASGRDEAAYRSAYVDATRELLTLDETRDRAFVYVSSTGVFGNGDGSIVDESTAPRPDDPTSRVLLEAESIVLDRPSGALSRVVRCSGLYGPGRLGTIERVRTGALSLGEGDDAWMNFVHRDDAASLVIAALDRGKPGGIYHASDAHPARRREVVTWIAERLGIEPHRSISGDAPAGRRGANRRVSAEASCRELGVQLTYRSFKEGFAPYLSR